MKYNITGKGELVTNVAGDDGAPIILNKREAQSAIMLQHKYDNEIRNALGFEVPITTLYAISKRITEQKFFQIAPAEYMPLRVGENAWSDNILTYRDYAIGGDFEAGNINTGASNTRLSEADAGIDSVINPVINWAKQISWSFPDLKMAARSGNWDLVTSKERARKKNWDLGIQKVAFLGSVSNPNVNGLFTQPNVTANTSLITAYINSLNAANFATFVQTIIGAYRSNCGFTAWPTHFIIPELDYNGLGALVPGSAGTFPIPMLDYLTNIFKLITRNPEFKILPCAYADSINNPAAKHYYTLLNYDEDSLRMDIPVDYSNTLQNTINGFQFQNVGYGQVTGVIAFRPLEMLYFDYAT